MCQVFGVRNNKNSFGGVKVPGGYIHTTIMELGPQNRKKDGLLGPNSIIVVHIPLP